MYQVRYDRGSLNIVFFENVNSKELAEVIAEYLINNKSDWVEIWKMCDLYGGQWVCDAAYIKR